MPEETTSLLPVTVQRLHFRADKPLHLGPFPGAIWRSALGARLRQLVCSTGTPRCAGCHLAEHCPYPRLFETRTPANPSSALLQYNGTTTPPFVISPEPSAGDGDPRDVAVRLTVVGDDPQPARLLNRALEEAASSGLGRDRIPLTLRDTDDCPLPPVPDSPDEATLVLHTPLRLKTRGHYLGPHDFPVVPLARALLRRITHLGASHVDGFDDRPLATLAREVDTLQRRAAELHWRDQHRYSARQKRRVPMGGLVGHITVGGPALPALWPWLWLGQWLHLGKGATMGMGRYTLSVEPG